MNDITVDRQTLKALGADTRIEILKALAERRKTQAELAHALSLSEAAVSEHLERLSAATLVQKAESGSASKKWKYYELTPKGRGIVQPSNVRVWFALAISILAFVASTNQVYFSLANPFGLGGSFSSSTASLADTFVPSTYASTSPFAGAPQESMGVLAVGTPMAAKAAAPNDLSAPGDAQMGALADNPPSPPDSDAPAPLELNAPASREPDAVALAAPAPLALVDVPAAGVMLLSLVAIGFTLGVLLDRRRVDG